MINEALQRYLDLKEKADRLRREADRAAGAEEQLMKRLKEEFGCDSVKKAESLLENLRQEIETGEEWLKTLMGEFESKWSDKLEEKE